jgi:hypothetical protein
VFICWVIRHLQPWLMDNGRTAVRAALVNTVTMLVRTVVLRAIQKHHNAIAAMRGYVGTYSKRLA